MANYKCNLLFLSLLLVLLGCKNKDFSIQEIKAPCKLGGEPNLFVSPSGQVILSWIEYLGDTTDVLAFSTLINDQWSAPKIIAKGKNWFVNWADFPSIITYPDSDKKIAAHWLQKSAVGTFDYDIHIAQSMDGGNNWQKSFIPHTDGIAAEHGFVSLLPINKDKIFATWLDGRYAKTENASDGHDHEGQKGAMTLRGVFFDTKGKLTDDIELDSRICDCCSTSAALTSKGIIIAYRDRSEEEIRDISIIRQIHNDWTQGRTVYTDNWKIAGCPVNGPKIIAHKEKVALAWFTMANDSAKVQLAISNDAGAHFSEPIRIDDGNALGRVNAVLDNSDVILSWLEQVPEKPSEALIRLARINKMGVINKKETIQKVNAARSTGFPKIAKTKDHIVLTWTELIDEEENTTIKTVLVRF